MGYKELIEAIKEEGEKRIKEIWSEAETRAGIIRKELELKIEGLKTEYGERFNSEIEKRKTMIYRDANKKASQIMLKASEELSERLFSIALSLLPNLRGDNYREVFKALLKEIPKSDWVTVKVNPEDITLAESLLPGAEVIGEGSIAGGFVVINKDGNLITNTFEKRLERLWPEILPEILRAIREMYEATDG